MICKNCGHEIIEASKGNYLHVKEINIGTDSKPKIFKSALQTCPTCNCIYPEAKKHE